MPITRSASALGWREIVYGRRNFSREIHESRTVTRTEFEGRRARSDGVAQKLHMATSGIGVAPAVAAQTRQRNMAAPRGVRRRPFYIGVSLLMGLIAIVGFWPTYFGPLVLGTISQPLLIHLHATVFSGWLVLFLTQVALAASGRVEWHMRLGRIGIGYGVLVVIVGLLTGISRAAHRSATGSGRRSAALRRCR